MSERPKALTRLPSTPLTRGIPVVGNGGGVGAIVGGTGVQSNDIPIIVDRAGVTVSVPGVPMSTGTGDCVDGVMHETGGGDGVGVQSGGIFATSVAPRELVPVPVPMIDVPVPMSTGTEGVIQGGDAGEGGGDAGEGGDGVGVQRGAVIAGDGAFPRVDVPVPERGGTSAGGVIHGSIVLVGGSTVGESEGDAVALGGEGFVGSTGVFVGALGVGVGGTGVEVTVGGMAVAVGGIGVAVGGIGVFVGGIGVAVGGTGVVVGGTGVSVGSGTGVGSGAGATAGGTTVDVGGTGVFVKGTGVAVGGIGVAVDGTGLSVGGTGVTVGGNGVGVQGEGPIAINPITCVAFGVPVVVASAIFPLFDGPVGSEPSVGERRATGVISPTIVGTSSGVFIGGRVGVGPVVLIGGRVIVTTGDVIAVTMLKLEGAQIVAIAAEVAVSSGVATTCAGMSASMMPSRPAIHRTPSTLTPLPKPLPILPYPTPIA